MSPIIVSKESRRKSLNKKIEDYSPDLKDLEILFSKVKEINLKKFIHKDKDGHYFEYNENMLSITTDAMNTPRIICVDDDLKIKQYGNFKDIIRMGRYEDIKLELEEFILKHV
jgi:hypothetical protein